MEFLAFILFVGFITVGAAVVVAAVQVGVRRRREFRAAEQRRRAIEFACSMELSRYYAMGPKQFEEALAYLCRRDGCTDVRVTGGRGDLGADVIATAPDGRRIVIQAKRYGPTSRVGSPDLQKFGGTCFMVHGAQVAVVVTTSGFTRDALRYAQHMGILTFDEGALGGWASRTGPAPWH